MKTMLAAMMLALGLGASAQAASSYPNVSDRSVVTLQARLMELSTVIAAPRAVLWRSLTDAEEMKKWTTPVAFNDIRPGGMMETSYDKKAQRGDANNIKNEVVAVEPERLLVFRNVQAPQGLPGRDRIGKVVTSIRFEDAPGGATRVTLWQVGYDGGEADKVLWDFFHTGNAYVLAEMDHTYGKGPKPGMPDGH